MSDLGQVGETYVLILDNSSDTTVSNLDRFPDVSG